MKKLLYAVLLIFATSQAFAARFSLIHSDFSKDAEAPGDSAIFSKSSQSNPFDSRIINGRLQISIKPGVTSGVVGLHDILGNRIFEAAANENIEWSLAGLKSGIYILVWKESRNSFTKRIVYRQEN